MIRRDQYHDSYKLTKKFGTSYFYATLLLSKENRRHIYALYSLCRFADDLVDISGDQPGMNSSALDDLMQFYDDVCRAIDDGYAENDLLGAIARTWNELHLDREYLERFFRSMRMDCEISTYDTFDDLLVYMDGSAAVIGEMVLPVIERNSSRHSELRETARTLGNAFQLTNFLRDVGEDVCRNRLYIPLKDCSEFGVDPENLVYNESFIEMMKFQDARNRQLYSDAYEGVVALSGRSGACVRTAYRLYGGILDAIEVNKYDVLSQRARLSKGKKIGTCIRELGRVRAKTLSATKF